MNKLIASVKRILGRIDLGEQKLGRTASRVNKF